jgi:3-deoxy-manno-octulosonate cytidylyltransferase (CMP-KDO synthetase)
MTGQKAVFLDRDGTVIKDWGYLDNAEQVNLLPGAAEALAELARRGFLLVLVTNQSGIGRGKFSRSVVDAQHARLHDLLAPFGVRFADIQICPHAPAVACSCRKPSPLMLIESARWLGVDLGRSFMVGDKPADVEAGNRAGCRSVFVGAKPCAGADAVAGDLQAAAAWILAQPEQGGKPVNMPFVTAVLPARYGSTRFPGKPLALIGGKPMVQWAYERACAASMVDEVVVATDDIRIANAVDAFGGKPVMTSPDHATGTDRIAEAVRNLRADIIVNVQGDEPLLPADIVDELVRGMIATGAEMGTAASPFSTSGRDPDDPNAVKVVLGKDNLALYFSRSRIPFCRQGGTPVEPLLHWGLYAYRRDFLEKFVTWPQGVLEQCEMLEQLRALENGARIFVVRASGRTVGVDTPGDVAAVEAILRERGEL